MRKILFVDDEPNVLDGLKRMLFPLSKEWKMAFVSSGAQALELMAQEPFDIVVSDVRMPGMDGAELLAQVRDRYPQTVRFVLSGQSDRETVLRSVGAAHQFLAKPCNPSELKSTVDRAFALRDVFCNEQVRELVSRIGTLPALPKAYSKLVETLQSPNSSIADVGRIIEPDVAMTAKVLQMVNSAFFGVRRHVATAMQAVSLLGLNAIRAIVLTAGVFQETTGKRLPASFSMEALWRHSITVGAYAQAITKAEGLGDGPSGEALTAGLLHDCGKLLLAVGCTAEYGRVLRESVEKSRPLAEIEFEAFACTHAEVGAYLLGIWGLPDPIVESAAFHHAPSKCHVEGFGPLIAVHVADAFAHEGAEAETCPGGELDVDGLARVGVADRLPQWREACEVLGKTGENDG